MKLQDLIWRPSSGLRDEKKVDQRLLFYRASNLKVLFLPCNKNASSSLIVWLAGLELRVFAQQDFAKLGVPTSRKKAVACLERDVIARPFLDDYLRRHSDYFIFGVSRNPYARIASAYRDKVNRLVKKKMPMIYVQSIIRQILEGPGSWAGNKPAIRYMREAVSFEDFLCRLVSAGLGVDDHYQLQAFIMRPDLLSAAQFFRLENLCETLVPAIADHLSRRGYGGGFSLEAIPIQNSTGDSCDYRKMYNDALMAVVADLYRADFESFRYDMGSF
jgi:hypothetical protein